MSGPWARSAAVIVCMESKQQLFELIVISIILQRGDLRLIEIVVGRKHEDTLAQVARRSSQAVESK